MKAWYFAHDSNKLRYDDDREIIVGETHTVDVEPILCGQGLHGSIRLVDALGYAPGVILYRVNIAGDIDEGSDKICGRQREYLYGGDITSVLEEFARKQALINIHKISKYCSTRDYELIVRWLETGDLSIKSAARSAASSAAESASENTTWSAANSAASSAASSAAWSAASSAASSAAWSAAWSAARSTSRSAAEGASYSAANEMLTQMVLSHFGKEE